MTLANYGVVEDFELAPVQAVGLPPEMVTRCVFFISVTAMLLGNFAGTIGAVVFLGLWVLLGVVYGKGCAGLLASGPRWLWALPLFLVCSSLWSQFPLDTLKFAMEFAATAGCAVLAASLMRPRVLVAVMTACLISTAVLSVIAGKQLVDPLTGAVAFVGVFELKNQLAFFTSLMLLAGIALSSTGAVDGYSADGVHGHRGCVALAGHDTLGNGGFDGWVLYGVSVWQSRHVEDIAFWARAGAVCDRGDIAAGRITSGDWWQSDRLWCARRPRQRCDADRAHRSVAARAGIDSAA